MMIITDCVMLTSRLARVHRDVPRCPSPFRVKFRPAPARPSLRLPGPSHLKVCQTLSDSEPGSDDA
eukprot:1472132-Rhodomonas_salina.3